MQPTLFEQRTRALQSRMADLGIDLAIITDEDSVYYFAGYHGYLHMDFGRPTLLLLWRSGEAQIITPSIEYEMAQKMCWIEDIQPWQDGVAGEWRDGLVAVLKALGNGVLAAEIHSLPPVVRDEINQSIPAARWIDLAAPIADLRMIKSAEEILLARHAGQVAEAMMGAVRDAIAVDVPEYEIALATMAAGTRKAADLLDEHYQDPLMSPNAHFLQTMASGQNTTMPHHRSTTRRLKQGEPVFVCFCGMTNFRRFKLGFDRMHWVGEVGDADQERVYSVALASQEAALAVVRPGVAAEEVHAAYAEVIQSAGFDFPFRCGRATGFSFLERPQLTYGDKTVLQPGMILAVDGSVGIAGVFRAQVGDSIVVTEQGYDLLTHYPKALSDVIVGAR